MSETTQVQDRYRIVKAWKPSPGRRWVVYLGETEYACFDLKRDAVAWVMKKEFPINADVDKE